MTTTRRTLLTSLLLLACAGTALAGNLDPPAAPTDPASALYTVNDLYNRLTTGAPGVKRTGPFAEPAASPAPTGHTSDELMAVAPSVDNANGAVVTDVVSGKSFWGLRSDGTWGLKVGAMSAQTLNPSSAAVAAGYYAATNLTTVDADLATANIKAGINIFGIAGKSEVVDTSESANPATATQILAGKKAFVNGAAVVGTVTVGGNVTGSNGVLSVPLPDGLYTGGKSATATDANLVNGNIRSGVTIFGVAGNPNVVNTSSGTAVASDLMAGKKAWVAGTEVNGTLAAQTLSPTSTVVPAGVYAATNLATVDPDLATTNIRAGVSIFGLAGNTNVVNTSTGTAVAADLMSGKKAWVAGTEVTGSLATQTLNPTSTTVPAGFYAATSLATVDPDLAMANIRAGVNVFGVVGKTEVVDTTEAANPALATQILVGKKAFVNGAAVVGTVPVGANVTGANGVLSITLPDGLYFGGKTATAGDANLVGGNIKNGTSIFGIAGSYTGAASVPAAILITGQTLCYDAGGGLIDCPGSGQDGTWHKGVVVDPRFTNNLNGTVTDNATGLIWLKNANCFGPQAWSTALLLANTMGNGACSLSDGSSGGQWRLPNVKELQSLIDYSSFGPTLPAGHPFINVRSVPPQEASWYWSSTNVAINTAFAWVVNLYEASVYQGDKNNPYYIWPVRGGQ